MSSAVDATVKQPDEPHGLPQGDAGITMQRMKSFAGRDDHTGL